MQEKPDNGKWVLGGCCISCVEVNGQSVDTMPTRRCNKCGKDFGTPPILITPKKDLAEDYRDIVTAIKFGVGGYFNGHTEITIQKNEKGALVKVRKMSGYEESPEPKQITPLKWNRIVNTLYGQMYLHEWKKKYVDPDVLDGNQWSLDIHLTDNRTRHYYGSNEYPPYWKELEKIFKELSRFKKIKGNEWGTTIRSQARAAVEPPKLGDSCGQVANEGCRSLRRRTNQVDSGLSCGRVANEGCRSLRWRTNQVDSGYSCGQVANEGCRSLRRRTNQVDSGLSCGQVANEGSRSLRQCTTLGIIRTSNAVRILAHRLSS